MANGNEFLLITISPISLFYLEKDYDLCGRKNEHCIS